MNNAYFQHIQYNDSGDLELKGDMVVEGKGPLKVIVIKADCITFDESSVLNKDIVRKHVESQLKDLGANAAHFICYGTDKEVIATKLKWVLSELLR